MKEDVISMPDPSGSAPPHLGSEGQEEEIDAPLAEDVDLQALAQELVALLKQELWLENERRGWRRMWE